MRILSLPGLGQSFLLLGIMAALSHFISPLNIIINILHVRVGDLVTFFYQSLVGTEGWTLVLAALFVLCLMSIRVSVFGNRRYAFARA